MDSTFTITRFPHHPENVPDELKADEERWVLCDEYKVPLIAMRSGACFAASSTDPTTWRSYKTALEAWSENEHFCGIGRVIEATEQFVGVDLDDCVNVVTGEVSPWALSIVERLDSYAEITPSKEGVKLWVKAKEVSRAYKKPGIEVYPKGRYFTMTGLIFPGARKTVEERGEELRAILDEEFPKVTRRRSDTYEGPARVLDLGQLLDRSGIEVFAELLDGLAERKFAVLCPWSEEHTNGDVSGSYCGQFENGALFYVCHHAHCAHRTWSDFRHYAESLAYLGRPPRSERGRLR
jgi:primase-polymerase (primpol)-like protein